MNINPEWIEWKGGDRPVGSDAYVAYQLRNGKRGISPSHLLTWEWDDDKATDIIAYCTLGIEPYTPRPKWTVEEVDQSYTWIKYKDRAAMTATSLEYAQKICDTLNNAGVEL